MRLGERALLLACVQVETGDLLGGTRMRRPAPAAARERRRGLLAVFSLLLALGVLLS